MWYISESEEPSKMWLMVCVHVHVFMRVVSQWCILNQTHSLSLPFFCSRSLYLFLSLAPSRSLPLVLSLVLPSRSLVLSLTHTVSGANQHPSSSSSTKTTQQKLLHQHQSLPLYSAIKKWPPSAALNNRQRKSKTVSLMDSLHRNKGLLLNIYHNIMLS